VLEAGASEVVVSLGNVSEVDDSVDEEAKVNDPWSEDANEVDSVVEAVGEKMPASEVELRSAADCTLLVVDANPGPSVKLTLCCCEEVAVSANVELSPAGPEEELDELVTSEIGPIVPPSSDEDVADVKVPSGSAVVVEVIVELWSSPPPENETVGEEVDDAESAPEVKPEPPTRLEELEVCSAAVLEVVSAKRDEGKVTGGLVTVAWPSSVAGMKVVKYERMITSVGASVIVT
jgi:hypothetical protein